MPAKTTKAKAAKTKRPRKKPPAPKEPPNEPGGGVEVVPLLSFRPGKAQHPWGDQFVSGTMDTTTSRGSPLTFPGVPVRVRTRAYAEHLVSGKLAKFPEDFRLSDLPSAFQKECGNPERWAHTVTTKDESDG